jgi:GTPase SAR1 family protein
MLADPSWAIPLAGQAIRNREEIAGAWNRLINRILGKHSRLAMTGMPGVGKTVLLDHLSGRAFDSAYQLPDTSAQVERETLRRKGQRLGLSVLPGQSSSTRLEGIDDLFFGKKPVRGVLHVVSFGYTETRSAFAVDAMKHRDLEELRKVRLDEELEDFQDTCRAIRSYWTRHREPIWLIVAANKVDLYATEGPLEAAHARYGEGSDSEFTAIANELQRRIGADNFSWKAAPVCSWLEDFKWSEETLASTLDMSQRNELLRRLGKSIAAQCEGAKDA